MSWRDATGDDIGDRSVQTINGVTRVRWDYSYAGVVLGVIALVVVYVGLRDLKEDIGEQAPAPHYAIFCGDRTWRSIRSPKARS